MTREARIPHVYRLIFALIPALVVGCGAGASRICAPGASIACACSDGRTGAQSCNTSGSGYGVCECTSTATGGMSGGGGSSAGTGGSGGAASGGAAGGKGGATGTGGGSAGTTGTGGHAGAGGASGATGTGGTAGAAGGAGQTGTGGSAGHPGGGAAGGTAGSSGGSGLFALAAVYSRAVASMDTVPTVADVDGDHILDLVAVLPPVNGTSAGGQQSISVWKGHGDGTFAANAVVTTLTLPSPIQGAASIADVDGDGRADADITTASSETYAFGQPDGTFVMGASWGGGPTGFANCGVGPVGGPGSWGILYAGLDAGGAANYAVATVKGLPNSSVTHTGPASLNLSVGAKGYLIPLGWGDVTGAGKLEFGLLGEGGAYPNIASPIEVLSWSGTTGVQPTTTEIAVPPLASGEYIGDAQMADLDGDGLADFSVSLYSEGCGVLWNDGGGAFSKATGIPCLFPAGAVGDFNGDRIPDIIVWNAADPSYIVFGDGARGFGRELDLPPFFRESSKTSSLPFWPVDVNNDGVLDLVFVEQANTPTNQEGQITYVYLSTARTPAPAQPDIQCSPTFFVGTASGCAPPTRF